MKFRENLQIDLWFAAVPARVYAAWTEPRLLAQWFAAHDWEVVDAEFVPAAGSSWRIEFAHPDGGRYVEEGEVERAEPFSLLEMTLRQTGLGPDPSETVVRVTIAPERGGTRMRFEQSGRFTEPSRSSSDVGWRTCFEKLRLSFSLIRSKMPDSGT
ncbi:SRPBCC domain-containing protein [Sphingopyxis sp. JAI128]|uniref:SRPBCC family protein n=1 Tax=Sphingopyxis sp. JAI128 TaxID=2723066 RepID=UPI00161EBB67|nr:SRPBCC domain-containing protein [Sphingopyxis sp. JAI128]MBB6426900.1 uncharacterized protein YndB with AHSA1/START domain [Sphingopyxis sp. JAI128]